MTTIEVSDQRVTLQNGRGTASAGCIIGRLRGDSWSDHC